MSLQLKTLSVSTLLLTQNTVDSSGLRMGSGCLSASSCVVYAVWPVLLHRVSPAYSRQARGGDGLPADPCWLAVEGRGLCLQG